MSVATLTQAASWPDGPILLQCTWFPVPGVASCLFFSLSHIEKGHKQKSNSNCKHNMTWSAEYRLMCPGDPCWHLLLYCVMGFILLNGHVLSFTHMQSGVLILTS